MTLITVAICTWNRASLLDQTLGRLRELRIPPGVDWELLVIDNNCTDDTGQVVGRHAAGLPLRCVVEPSPGLSNARNRAMDEARGELILWTDDDVLVDTDWLSSVVRAAAGHPEAAGFGGPIAPWFPCPVDPLLAEAFPILKMGYCGLDYGRDEGSLADDEWVFGANMAFRASAVRGIRYNPRLGPIPKPCKLEGKSEISLGGGDDVDYIRSVRARGGSICWVPSMRVRHYVSPERITLIYLKSLYAEYGQSWIRTNGIPEGPRILGAPRWIVRRWLTAGLRSIGLRLVAKRRESLEQTRERSYYHGMIAECRISGRGGIPGGNRTTPAFSEATNI